MMDFNPQNGAPDASASSMQNDATSEPPSGAAPATAPLARSPMETFLAEPLATCLALYAATMPDTTRSRRALSEICLTVGTATAADISPGWTESYLASAGDRLGNGPKWTLAKKAARYLEKINAALHWRADSLGLSESPVALAAPAARQAKFVSVRLFGPPVPRRAFIAAIRRARGKSTGLFRLFARFALETGARVGEITQASWAEIATDSSGIPRIWTIPGGHNKNGRCRAVPLNAAASRIIRVLGLIALPFEPRLFPNIGSPQLLSARLTHATRAAGIDMGGYSDLRKAVIDHMVRTQRQFTVRQIIEMTDARMHNEELYKKRRSRKLVA